MSDSNIIKEQEINIPGEKRYEEVYGDTFGLYSKEELQEFMEPLKIRFEKNHLDAKEIFTGKKCFDAGCGNGRGALFMLLNGAEHVTAYDFTEKNIETTKKFINDFGFNNIKTLQGSLENIPFENESFDFIWCNGVIMHTDHPNKCLSEITRILKLKGKAWLYIYGSGGIYWQIIYHLREMMKDVKIQQVMTALKLYRYSTRYIAEFIDDWYATNLRSYTQDDLKQRLQELGFESPCLLKYGMDYDTNHRRNTFSTDEEKILMGEGDLRCLLTKVRDDQVHNKEIPETEYGSNYLCSDTIKQCIDPLFREIKDMCSDNHLLKVAAAAHIQRELRLLLSEHSEFTLNRIERILQNIVTYLKEIK